VLGLPINATRISDGTSGILNLLYFDLGCVF
jgi:hypothetical protein